jgi:hypothetical protein
MTPAIREEDGQFVVYVVGPMWRCATREEAEAILEGLNVFHSPRPTRQRVQIALDRLARVGIHQHNFGDNGVFARQVAGRLESAEQPWA